MFITCREISPSKEIREFIIKEWDSNYVVNKVYVRNIDTIPFNTVPEELFIQEKQYFELLKKYDRLN